MKEQDLITKCINGSKGGQKALYMFLVKDLFGLCRRYSTDDHQAKDYMQEGFIKIFANLDKYDATKSKLLTWSKRIVVNTILSIKRKRTVALIFPDAIPLHNTEEKEQSSFSREDMDISNIVFSLRKLPEHYQQIINLYLFEGWTHKEIATKLNIKESTSRSLLTRAKQQLKKKLNLETKRHESTAV